ncbi:MAG: hypothetical protein Q8O13_08770 [Candidatus Omnitrophota bacterium]|nr:hypothetical protein [Candidatus Omnitrophota bacterium]
MIWPTKKLGEILVGAIFVISGFFLLYKEVYGWGVLLISLLLILLKLDSLTEFAINLTGGLKTKFVTPGVESKIITEKERGQTNNVAIVSYKISSHLPGTVLFDFLKDWKVWFWVANHDAKKYRVYIKIKFIADGTEREVADGYYGGTQAWKLDAFAGIQAPGLGIPEEIKNAVIEGKRVKIQINCDVKDENDNLLEKKFPQTYIYDSQNNSWFLEP